MVDYRPDHSEGRVAAAPRKEEKNMTLTELENELDMIAEQMDAVRRMLDTPTDDHHPDTTESR